jgi:hypothetical protein
MSRQSLLILAASGLSTNSVSAFSAARSIINSRSTPTQRSMSVLDSLFGPKEYAAPCVMGDESIMSQKKHGTSDVPAQKDLRWNCDYETADRICNFNRHYAEHAGYWTSTKFVEEARAEDKENGGKGITFYGKLYVLELVVLCIRYAHAIAIEYVIICSNCMFILYGFV